MSSLPAALSAVRSDLGLTQGELAGRIGWHSTTISRREHGSLGVSSSDLEAFVKGTNRGLVLLPDGWHVLNPSELRPDPWREEPATGESRAQLELQVFGQVSAGPGIVNDDDGQWLDLVDIWRRSIDGVAQVTGDSMEPLLRNGDWVGVRTDEELAIGDVAVFRNGWTDQVQIKAWGGVIADRAVLLSLNAKHAPVQHRLGELQILGVAVGMLRTGRLRAEW